jgi:hypothetical protein
MLTPRRYMDCRIKSGIDEKGNAKESSAVRALFRKTRGAEGADPSAQMQSL